TAGAGGAGFGAPGGFLVRNVGPGPQNPTGNPAGDAGSSEPNAPVVPAAPGSAVPGGRSPAGGGVAVPGGSDPPVSGPGPADDAGLDPAELAVLIGRLTGVADEMGEVLRRAAFSPNIKERADCSAALFTADGTL